MGPRELEALAGPNRHRRPRDARHGGLILLADAEGVTAALERSCEAFAELGYETVALAVDAAVEPILAQLAGPVFVMGFGAGAARAWTAARTHPAVAAVSLLYPQTVLDLSRPPASAAAIHLTRDRRQDIEDSRGELSIFAYDAADGFFCDTDPRFDPQSARLALLRTLALFRRTVARGEV